MGVGWYRTTFHAPAGKQITLMFDGAMSEARIYVNGKEIGFWPWGYNSFYFDVTPYVNKDGQANTLAVRLETVRSLRAGILEQGFTGMCMSLLRTTYTYPFGVQN